MKLNLSAKNSKELQEIFDGIANAKKFEHQNQQRLRNECKQVERD